jgi:flagellar motility protein MotE (MotC chaperone)
MREQKVAPILAQMQPTKAKDVTFELAQRRQLPVPK